MKPRNERDRLSYDTNLEIGCFVHVLTPFLKAMGSSSLSWRVSGLPENEGLGLTIGSDSGQSIVPVNCLFP